MKLHWSPASPFARKCLVCLKETGQEAEIVPCGGTPMMIENMPVPQNPLGKIPALERDNGPALYDSRVITRYLDAQGEGNLYPDTRLWEVLTLESLADGIMDAALLVTYEDRIRPEAIRFPDWAEAQWAKVDRALAALERQWMSHLNGPPDMGQIAVACALAYLDFRHGTRNWHTSYPSLSDWEQAFAEYSSMAETKPRDP
ncbi:MAG: glutathione S-transferase family protein [Rhodobacteraceae bacterium]|nr:glutathione S-transferase family protein [Paracoccaceae bacterium]